MSSAEVDQREHVVDGVVVLGDAERPADHARGRRARRRGRVSRMTSAGTPVSALAPLERARLDASARTSSKPLGGALDEGAVREAGVDDLARHRVRERDVGADVEAEPAVGPLRRRRAARVDDEQPRAVVDALEHVVEEDRMRLAGVRAPEDDDVRLLDLRVGDVPPPAPNTVARPTTLGACQVRLQRVDVVRAHHLTRRTSAP